jgi:DNA invertase Pin-like site-specific DNA recombinase
VLVVEEVRRFSREGAYTTFRESIGTLIENDITLYIINPELTVNRKTLEKADTQMMLALLLIFAQAESQQKSEWSKATWREKENRTLETGETYHGNVTEWIVKKKDGTRELVSKAAGAAFVMMFQQAEQGLKPTPILKYLKAHAKWAGPKPKKKRGSKNGEMTKGGWNIHYVKARLSDRRLIGENIVNGTVIPDYYPNVFAEDPGLFERVQQINKEKNGKNKGGRNDKLSNLFQKLVFCPYCGGSMHHQPKGRDYAYLYCYDKKTKSCESARIRYDEVEKLILANCPRLKPEQVLPNQNDQARLCNAIQQRVERTKAELADVREQIPNFVDQMGRTKHAKVRDDIERKLVALYDQETELDKRLAEEEKEHRQAERSRKDMVKLAGRSSCHGEGAA